ncbi:hypothetical protein [Kitasatospora sp. CB01950]|uniref:hypothetical protein n=1 Tax=Kitasatospora sp. CB01950 TaxID=1703930 RepID=UPI00093C10E0|nr:hypothetical protein [Kitasatospora sp. CB01950]OKJ13979.1 hypothetical protein AMK19_11565 [Kitasatospora sp. CB01950]
MATQRQPKKPDRTRKPDRTKNGPTPKRGEPRPAGPRNRAARLLLPAIQTAIGALLLFGGILLTQDLADQHHRPELRMTVTSCATQHHAKSSTTTCYGTADPAGTGLTGRRRQLQDAPQEYPAGTVVKVRCTEDGVCDALTVGRHVLAILSTVGGLLLAGAGLAAVTVRAVDRYAPHRAELLRSRRVRRALARSAVGAVLLTVAGSLLYMFI